LLIITAQNTGVGLKTKTRPALKTYIYQTKCSAKKIKLNFRFPLKKKSKVYFSFVAFDTSDTFRIGTKSSLLVSSVKEHGKVCDKPEIKAHPHEA
jgi:hypothetical protein